MENTALIKKLQTQHRLCKEEWTQLFGTYTAADCEKARAIAAAIARQKFQNKVYFRGIIEFTNYCKNDCYYCGIRCANQNAARYRLSKEDILLCCEEGYHAGFRTFVLQGGEDPFFSDERLCSIIKEIKERFPDCAVTLSVGERSRSSYQRLFDAGADRYLLRHETANPCHYQKLHPKTLSLENRLSCLHNLKEIGFQTGCGCMVGSPYQTDEDLADDFCFMQDFAPQMIGIGPFIPHKDTPFRGFPAGSSAKTLFLLSLCRIMLPDVLLPATTALGTVQGDGRKLGVLAGANVVMPNLSPMNVRKKYMLYDNKIGTEDSAADGIKKLQEQMNEIGFTVSVARGDFRKENEND